MIKGITCVGLLFTAIAAGATEGVRWKLGDETQWVQRAQTLANAEIQNNSEGLIRLFEDTSIRFESNRVVERVAYAYYYGGADVVQQSGTDEISWDVGSAQLSVLGALSIDREGKATQFDPANARIIDNDSNNVFSDRRSLVIQLPGLGDSSVGLIVYELIHEADTPYFRADYLRRTGPTRKLAYNLEWSDERPKWHPPIEMMRCDTQERSVRCVSENLPGVQSDYSVLYADEEPQFIVASSQTWDDVIGDLQEKMTAATSDSQALAGTMKSLSQSEDVIRSIHDFVSRQVRYVSFSRGEHSHLPHHIDQTLGNRYGDCKDKSALMLAMLRSQGIEAFPALVATYRSDPANLVVPSVGYFNHMVVCIAEDDREHCFDPTDSETAALTTPAWIQNRVRLDLKAGSLPSTVPRAKHRWRADAQTKLEFRPDGSQLEYVNLKYFGEWAANLRSSLAGKNGVQRKEVLEGIYHAVVTSDVKLNIEDPNYEQINSPLNVVSHAEFDELLDPEEDLQYSDYDYWLRKWVQEETIQNEHYDQHFAGAHFRSSMTVVPPAQWHDISTSGNTNYESRFGSFTKKAEVKDGVVHVEYELMMPERSVTQAEKGAFNLFLKWVADEARFNISAREHKPGEIDKPLAGGG